MNPHWSRKYFISNTNASLQLLDVFTFLGEGLIQGGWIIFDKNGVPQAAFQENAKERIPIDDILAELRKLEDQAN